MAQVAVQQFAGWYDTAAITSWSARLAAQMEAVQRVTAQTTDAYLARVLTLLTGRRFAPTGRVDVGSLRAGVTHAGAYARAADAFRWQQAQHDQTAAALLSADPPPRPPDLAAPVDAALQRVADVAEMDVQLADRAQTRQVYGAAHDQGLITGYRRVIHPELSKGGTCGLCIAASDRLYGPTELKPLHARCECTTLPVLDHADPGSALNAGDLRRLYGEGGSTNRADLKRTRYQVTDHGELGPLLDKHGVPVRTEKMAARDANGRPRRPQTPAERAANVVRIRQRLEQALPKAQQLAQEDQQQWGRYLADLEARIADLTSQISA